MIQGSQVQRIGLWWENLKEIDSLEDLVVGRTKY